LSAALTRAYHTYLMTGRYPLAVLFLQLPAEMVDVNVHPTKAEVRFRQQDQVFTGLQSAVRRALLAHNPAPTIGGQLRWTPEQRDWERMARRDGPSWGLIEPDGRPHEGSLFVRPEEAPPPGSPEQPALPGERLPLLRPVGQVASAYLVAEGPDGLYLIDQHAAHERILFERFTAMRAAAPDSSDGATDGQAIPSQSLLQPANVELPAASARILSEQLPMLSRLGFKVEAFGPNTFLVRAIPNILEKLDPVEAIQVLVEDFEEDETPLQSELEARIIARVCKRAAVKAGQTLSPQEQRALVLDLEACQNPRTCPHGRPTMIHLSVDLLERQFGRRGAR
jgi:DNA mismatch repair protein MutL